MCPHDTTYNMNMTCWYSLLTLLSKHPPTVGEGSGGPEWLQLLNLKFSINNILTLIYLMTLLGRYYHHHYLDPVLVCGVQRAGAHVHLLNTDININKAYIDNRGCLWDIWYYLSEDLLQLVSLSHYLLCLCRQGGDQITNGAFMTSYWGSLLTI